MCTYVGHVSIGGWVCLCRRVVIWLSRRGNNVWVFMDVALVLSDEMKNIGWPMSRRLREILFALADSLGICIHFLMVI